MLDIRDFANIQAAIDAAESVGGGKVYVPPGQWDHGDLYVSGAVPVRLVGECWASKLHHTGSGDGLTIGSLTEDRTSDSGVCDLLMIGGPTSQSGIRMSRMHSAFLRGVRARNFNQHGASLAGCYASAVRECYLNNNGGDGLQLVALADAGTDYMDVTGTKCLANGARGIYVDNRLRASAGGNISRNDIEGNAIGLKIDTGSLGNSDAWAIEGNYFEGQTGHSAEIGCDGGSGFLRGVGIRLNTVNGSGGAVNAFVLDRVQDAVITANRLSNADLTITANTHIAFWAGNANSGGAFPGGFVNGDAVMPRAVIRQGAATYASISMSGDQVKLNYPLNIKGTIYPPS